MAEENQTGFKGILGGKLLGKEAEQKRKDVPFFDTRGLQIVVIGKDGEIMGTLGKNNIGEMKSKSGVGSLLGGVGDMPKEGEVKTTRIEKLDIPLRN